MKCCIQNCSNNGKLKKLSQSSTSDSERITFHLFPKDPKQRVSWLESLAIPNWVPTNRTVICSDHFKEEDFYFTKQGTRRIKYGVIPFIEDDCYGPAALRVCKLCLSLDGKMYRIQDNGLDKMYQDIMGKLPGTDTNNRLPMGICLECTARLQSAASFRSKALFSDALLQDHLKSNADLKISDIVNIHRRHTNLKSTWSVQEVFKFNSHDAEAHAPNTFIKTEVIGIPHNEEVEIEVHNLVTDKIIIKDERKNEIIEETYPSADVKTEIDLIPITEIEIGAKEIDDDDDDDDDGGVVTENIYVNDAKFGLDNVVLLKNEEDIVTMKLSKIKDIGDSDEDDEQMDPSKDVDSDDDDVPANDDVCDDDDDQTNVNDETITNVNNEAIVCIEKKTNAVKKTKAAVKRKAKTGDDVILWVKERLTICNINELPVGRGLETAMNPKRLRMWQSSKPASPPPSSPPPLSPSVAPPSLASCSVPSPAIFLECGDLESVSSSLPTSPMQHPSLPPSRPQHLRDEDIGYLIDHGSDADSDESDDEEDTAVPVIPRIFRSMMETPLDQDDEVTGDPAPAADTAPADIPLTMTDQPWGLHNFDWRAFPTPPISPESRRETFSEINVGPTTPCSDPYDIFIEIWDRQIMEHIASQTNQYAQQVVSQMFENHNLHPRSRISRWHDTTADELYVYFGLILAMAIVVKSRLEEYWGSTPDIFFTPGFRAHMSIDRFLLLNKCLHFSNNDDMRELRLDYIEARLFKIHPILSHLNKKFQEMYTPSQNIALDESLLMWKGRLEFCQLIPNKAANRGIKTYEICESQTGYLWRFEVHAHKKLPSQQFQDPLEASTTAIV